MKINSIETEVVKCISEGEHYDFDRYNVEVKTPLATKEYSVTVDFINKEISGDTIQYGSWYELEQEELKAILESVEKEGKILRPFQNFLLEVSK